LALRQLGFIDLPPHLKGGGFDHAAVHEPTGRIYVAHTANDAVDVIDITAQRYLRSIPDLPAVASALVSEPDLVFTSNRGENTVGLFTADVPRVEKIGVGIRPNGLAYDPRRARLLVAHVGDPSIAGSFTVSVIDVRGRKRVAHVAVAGRTRWAIYDPVGDAFHVTSPIHRRSLSSSRAIRCASVGSSPSRTRGRTASISTSRDVGCSARLTPASS